MQLEQEVKLPPLPKKLDGEYEEATLVFNRCSHELEIVSSTHVRCKKCSVGWTGQDAYKLAS